MRKFAIASTVLLGCAWMAMASDPALIDAAQSNDHAAAMKLVTAKGTNVNVPGADGTTAVMYAAANNDLELVKALIKAGADVKGQEPVRHLRPDGASIIGATPIIEALLKAGADPNFRTTDGETPLMAAARSGKVDAAKALRDAGADVNAKENWGGQTALMWPPRRVKPRWSSSWHRRTPS